MIELDKQIPFYHYLFKTVSRMRHGLIDGDKIIVLIYIIKYI